MPPSGHCWVLEEPPPWSGRGGGGLLAPRRPLRDLLGVGGSVGKEAYRVESDSFVPTDSSADEASGGEGRFSGEGLGDGVHGFLDESPPDIVDWNFWDELIKDPEAWKVS